MVTMLPVTVRVGNLEDDECRDRLTVFLPTQEFPFHLHQRRSRHEVESDISGGRYDTSLLLELWVAQEFAGFAAFEDIEDEGTMLDLRIAASRRGQGVGTYALPICCAHVFEHYPVRRIEGVTRQDNLAMRKVFHNSGFVLESYYREGWSVGDRPVAALGYALLRSDWVQGTATPVPWSELLAQEANLD